MARRNANGEGTVYKRKDGRWDASAYLVTTSGHPRRRHFYGRTRKEAHDKLLAAQAQVQRGVSLPDKNWKLGEYLDYWLENVVHPTKRPSTYEQYAWIANKFLKPNLGSVRLQQLTVPKLQMYLNERHSAGYSSHRLRLLRMVLGAVLKRAEREELITRNVARHVEIPSYEPVERHPWSVDEARTFYGQLKNHTLYPAFVLLQVYGLRRGEVLGLRWSDIDIATSTIRIRNQLQRTAGQLRQGPVKTKAGNRNLKLIQPVRTILEAHLGRTLSTVTDSTDQLVFTRDDVNRAGSH